MHRLNTAALACSVLLAAGCRGRTAEVQAAKRVDFTLTLGREDVARAAERTLVSGPAISGVLSPRKEATVRAEISGALVENKAEPGLRVRKGEVLARIRDRATDDLLQAAQQSVRSARDALRNAKREDARNRLLARGGSIAPRDLDRSRVAVAQAQAQLAQARSQLAVAEQASGRRRLEAPIDGVISEKQANAGDIVQVGSPIFTLVDLSSLRLEAAVPADAVAHVAVGATVDFTVTGHPDRTFQGTIEQVNPAVDPATGQVRIYVALPNARGVLLAGLFARGRVATRSQRGVAVPLDAVDLSTSPPSVLVLQNGKVQRVQVELGIRDEVAEQVLVTKGLAPGAVVLLGPGRAGVPEGASVRVADAG
jgi:RND family efflux transporter MFP subunit